MKLGIQLSKLFLIITFVFASFSIVSAQNAEVTQPGPSGPTGQAEVTQPGPSKEVSFIRNPLKSDINTLPALIEAIIDLLLWVAVPVVVLIIIWVGFQFVLAQGNESKLTDAKKALWYALIGIAVLFGAKVIASIVENTVGSILR